MNYITNIYGLDTDLFKNYNQIVINNNISINESILFYIENKIKNSNDSGKLYNIFKEYLFKCTEGKEYKKIIETLVINKIKRCLNLNFETFEEIDNHNEENDFINKTHYINSIENLDLKSYKNLILLNFNLIKTLINNYNYFGKNINVVKFYNSIQEINEFNSNRSKNKSLKKDKDNSINSFLLNIFVNIVQLYNDSKVNISEAYENYLNNINKSEIESKFKVYIHENKDLEKYLNELFNESDEVVQNDYAILINEDTGNSIYKYVETENNITWKQDELISPINKLDLKLDSENKYIQAEYLLNIFDIFKNKDFESLDKNKTNYYFSSYRLNAIKSYINNKYSDINIKSILIKLIDELFNNFLKFNYINNVIENLREISNTKNNLLFNLENYEKEDDYKEFEFDYNINKDDYVEYKEENENEEILNSIILELKSDYKNKIIIQRLKKFIEKFGHYNKDENKIFWLKNGEITNICMLCGHYHDYTKQLNLPNEKIINFHDNFLSKYRQPLNNDNGDKNIYCKYCQENIGQIKFSGFEGFDVNIREAYEEDKKTIIDIVNEKEWDNLNKNEKEILNYVLSFGKRLNIKLKNNHIHEIIQHTTNFLKTKTRFDKNFILKKLKDLNIDLEDDLILFIDKILSINNLNLIESNCKKIYNLDKSDLESDMKSLLTFQTLQSGGSKKAKKKLEELKRKKRKKRKQVKKQDKDKENKLKKEKRYCKTIEKIIIEYKKQIGKDKLFCILSYLFVILQTSIPDYNTFNIGNERESGTMFTVNDYYFNTNSLKLLFIKFLLNDKKILSKKSVNSINYTLIDKNKKLITELLNKNIENLKKVNKNKNKYRFKKIYRQNKYELSKTEYKWENFKPNLNRNDKNNNSVIQTIYDAVNEENFDKYVKYIKINPIDSLNFQYTYLKNFHYKENILVSLVEKEKDKNVNLRKLYNTIFPPKKINLFIHKPLNYLNKGVLNYDILYNDILNLLTIYNFENEQIEKRFYVTIKNYNLEIESELETNLGDYEYSEIDLISSLNKKEIIEQGKNKIDDIIQSDKTQLINFYNQLVNKLYKKNKINKISYNIDDKLNLIDLFPCEDELNCLINNILNNKETDTNKYNSIINNYDELGIFNHFNINEFENNKFYKIGLKNIELKLTLEGLNKYKHKVKYEKKLYNEINILKLNLKTKESNYIIKFIKILIYHLSIIKNKFNKIKEFPGSIKSDDKLNLLDNENWFETIENNKKQIINDFSSVSKKDYFILKKNNNIEYSKFYELIKNHYTNDINININNLFQEDIIKNCNSILELFKNLNKKNIIYKETVNFSKILLDYNKYNLLIKCYFILIINKLKQFLDETVLKEITEFIKKRFDFMLKKIDLINEEDIEKYLNLDKASLNKKRKDNFDRKTKSEKNIYLLRRTFNLGNIEQKLEEEIVNISDDINHIQGDLLNVKSEDDNDEYNY